MWKFVTRGIRESLERRASCRTNVYSQTSNPDGSGKNEVRCNLPCNHKFLEPTTFQIFTNDFCGSSKSHNGAKNKRHDSRWNAKHTWSEAVGWSSILAVGWVVCQSVCLRRRYFEKDPEECGFKLAFHPGQPKLSHLLNHLLALQPKHVLPVINCVGKNTINNSDGSKEDLTEKPKFGPVTVEEALHQATNEFTFTHKLVMGEFELRFGIKALEEKRYKDAVKHFRTGAKLSSPGSMFNLGLCYELGLGILADQTLAAKHYCNAAEQGHADAIYNLGVFHAQGRGGLSVNTDTARSLFTKAASLGHVEAKYALSLDKAPSESDIPAFKSTYYEADDIYENSDDIFMDFTGYNDTFAPECKKQQTETKERYLKHGIDKVKDSTEIFLDLLGINDSNSRSIVSLNDSNSNVPF